MLPFRRVMPLLAFVTAFLSVGTSSSQDFPQKPIRIVTAGVGGGNDFVARAISPRLSAAIGQQVIIENRPSGLIAAEILSKAPPDGYSLLFASSSLWIGPLIQNVPYNYPKDFSPITLTSSSPHVIVVHPSLPVKTTRELIALAKARPGQLNYVATSVGGSPHLAAELFKFMAQVDIVRITYKSSGPALNDLIGGHVHMMFSTVSAAAPHMKSGRLKALAVTSAKPTLLAPGLPTVTATALPDFESGSLDAVFVPAKTPESVVRRLNQELVRVLSRTDIKEKFLVAGLEAVGSSPVELTTAVDADVRRMGKVIKALGIRAE